MSGGGGSGEGGSGGARFDLPEVDGFTRTFWDAAAGGRLLLRRCGAAGCGRAHHYPREFCPYCWSEDVRWEEASGRATLYTWSVVHRNDLPPFGERTPYVPAVVDLAEGPRMMTEVVPYTHLTLPTTAKWKIWVVAVSLKKKKKHKTEQEK
ncbi:Zn-ribbon domain-containing OB-fold protein [Streptomyces scabiei]|uniref:Zn-ribbon domain-containing OB-fold protein n=1 Tax=Streptomyces scabiei TaxID=1930 RepID=UPI0029B769A8|nr:OB-fold domain-containing protein [Streptomyces scabiei]MDX2690717.1 OB-fold domain-containing protein [Streptomyces scabiei]